MTKALRHPRALPYLFLIAILFISVQVSSQQPPVSLPTVPSPAASSPPTIPKQMTSVEICDNGTDDDGNGLTDADDYQCYFNSTLSDSCVSSKVVWLTSNFDVLWVNTETGEERIVATTPHTFTDLCWSPKGKLYASGYIDAYIYELDPATGETSVFADLQNEYYFTNAMTCDAAGNLYLASFLSMTVSKIVKLDHVTKQTTVVVDLSQHGLVSAGDLTFLNGYIYVACLDYKLARINLATKQVETFAFADDDYSPVGSYGLTTIGDGYLYYSRGNAIWRVNPETMKCEAFHDFETSGILISGLATYPDQCNAPVCRPKMKMQINSSAPFCAATGVQLQAKGSGIKGEYHYQWTSPDGVSVDGESIFLARKSGMYKVKYSSLPDTCSITDSIQLKTITTPIVDLGDDTTVCSGTSILISPRVSEDIASYAWSDGSTSSVITVSSPGQYSLRVSNACGSNEASTYVKWVQPPVLQLGNDTLLCPGSTIIIQNGTRKQEDEKYLWSTGTIADKINVSNAGIYWLQSQNACGAFRDSILVITKDSCSCAPQIAKANLGSDFELCTYDTALLSNKLNESGFTYRWNDGSTSPTLVAKSPGLYWVDVRTYCNVVRDSILITKKNEGCECFLSIPSAFSPNGDGKNDRFDIVSTCPVSYELMIYNRWGSLVYSSSERDQGWSGRLNNSVQPTGTFIYVIRYSFNNRLGSFVRKGVITLVR